MKYFVYLTILGVVSHLSAQIEEASDCAACHESINRQWNGSMHAKSTADQDILYAKIMEWAIKDTKGKAEKLCAGCHRPYAKLEVDEPIKQRPVDCVFCHSIDSIHKTPLFTDTKYSARENDKSDYHTIKRRDHFTNNELCFSCHGVFNNPKDIPICITEIEYRPGVAKGNNCNSCHMPLKKGNRSVDSESSDIHSHEFIGPHTPGFLENSLGLKAEMNSGRLQVTISNENTPHGFPTGSPLRMVVLEITGLDKDNEIVYKNFQEIAAKDDPKALFMRVFSDVEGKFPVPPWQAAAVKMDNRLKAGEVRTLSYDVPPVAYKAHITLTYRFAPLTILSRLKIDDPYLSSEHLIAEYDIEIKE